MDIIAQYIETALELERMKNTKTVTKAETNAWVRKYNKLAAKLRNTAIEINNKYPKLKEDFFRLLYHENTTVRNWVMFQILDAMDYDFDHRKKAMEAILKRKETDWEVDMVFDALLDERPEYRELL